jgi:hypothetical protein
MKQEYPIEGIRSQLPSAMNEQQRESKVIFLFGHPGWNRYDAKAGVAEQYRKFMNYYTRNVAQSVKEKGIDKNLFRFQIPKKYATFTGQWDILLEELLDDTTFQFAKKLRIPTIVSISCEQNGNGYKTKDGIDFKEYINYHIGGNPNFFVLPTLSNSGIIQNGEQVITVRDAALFHKTEQGRKIFGDSLSNFDRRVLIAGGDLDACLLSTIFYFGDQKKWSLMGSHIVASFDPNVNVSQEDAETAKDLVQLLHSKEKEPTARRKLIRLLRKDWVYPKEKREEIYSKIGEMVQIIGPTR